MKTVVKSSKNIVQPYTVQQAVIAMEMKKDETPFLEYVDFWQQHILTHQSLFLHVLPIPNVFSAMFEAEAKMLISNFSLTALIKEEMEKRVRTQLIASDDTTLEFEVLEGNPLKELLSKITENKADLVIIGQRLEKGYHGIFAKKLAQKTPCDTLIIPDDIKPPKLKKILIPIDFSPITSEIIKKAISIRKQLAEPVELMFLNVYEDYYADYSYLQISSKKIDTLFKKDRALVFDNYIKTYLSEDDLNVKMKLVEKSFYSVGKYISEYALKEDIDLIIMGAKGHSKIEVLFMGSVTEQVLSTMSKIPILLIKEPKKGIW